MDYVTRNEAAVRAGVHRNTIIEWERRGMLRTRRASGPGGELVLVSVEDLARVIAERPVRSREDEDRVSELEHRVAALELELADCRERLERAEAERAKLFAEVLAIARGRRRQ